MSYLCYLCLLALSGVQRISCCVFVLFVFLLCTHMVKALNNIISIGYDLDIISISYDLETTVDSLRRVYFAKSLDNLLVQLVDPTSN